MQSFTDARGPETPDDIWLTEHPPVYTLGLGADPSHVLDAHGIPVVQTRLAHDVEQAVTAAGEIGFPVAVKIVSPQVIQAAKDYADIVNLQGGIEGRRVEILVEDHGNEPQRGIECYEKLKREGVMVFDFLSTPVSRAVLPRPWAAETAYG